MVSNPPFLNFILLFLPESQLIGYKLGRSVELSKLLY